MSQRNPTPAYVCIAAKDFDEDKLVISNVKKNTFGAVTMIQQTITYLVNGAHKDLYVKLPEQSTFGFSYAKGLDGETAPAQGERKEVSATEAKSIQVSYPLGEAMPLQDEERAVEDMFRKIRIKVLNSLVEEVNSHPEDDEGKNDSEMGGSQYSVLAGAIAKKTATHARVNNFIKDPFAPVKDQNTKQADPSKPKRAYFKVLSKAPKTKTADGKWVPTGAGLQIEAKIIVVEQDGSNRMVTGMTLPDDINGARGGFGRITPVIHINGTYIGAHGTNPHIASVQCKVVNARYEKRSSSHEAPNFFEDMMVEVPSVRPPVSGEGFEDLTQVPEAAPEAKPAVPVRAAPPKTAKAAVRKPIAKPKLANRPKAVPRIVPVEEEDQGDDE
jgi:hypothetical protein